MPPPSKVVTDGNVSFIGGMDTSRAPSLVGKHQYVWSVNMEIPRSKEGIRTRRGFRCIKVKTGSSSDKEIFDTGNVQGIGSYYDRFSSSNVIVVSINGYIIEIKKQIDGTYEAFFTTFINNPTIKSCHINSVPNGVIVNDGESAPIFIFDNKRGRVMPSNKQIGPSHGGVYVQNRFWYIDQSRKYVIGSTIQDPTSLEEGILSNIPGFVIPDETEEFIAIGKQKTISRDATGGNLAIASTKSNYSVDVRGSRDSWGSNSGIGKIDNVVNGVGAISPFSFESANSNTYFRNIDYGLMSIRSSQYQFTNNDSYSSVSMESSLFFDNDTKDFLEHCYTKFYKTKLFTTVSPQINQDGFVFWNGLLVLSPDIYFSTKDRAEINRLESVYTGIRPWCMTVAEDVNGVDNMFIMSYDHDCINRLYIIDEDIDYDVDINGNKIEIESKILTRLFDFGSPFLPKQLAAQLYFIDSKRDFKLDLYSRLSPESSFKKIFSEDVELKTPGKGFYPFNTDSRISDTPISFADADEFFYHKQDLFVFKGSVILLKLIRSGNIAGTDLTVPSRDFISLEKSACITPDLIYTYAVSEILVKDSRLGAI